MIQKITIVLLILITLASCTSNRTEIVESQEYSQSAPSVKSDSAIPLSENRRIGTVQIVGGDEEALRDFIKRWFTPLYPGITSERETIIRFGALPDDLAIDFPLPENSQVVASVQDPYLTLQVIVDVASSLEDILASYPQILANAGWSLAPEISSGGGFVSSADPWLNFCADQDQAALTVQAFPGSNGFTDVRLNLNTENIKYICDPDSSQGMDPAYTILPALKMPSGALMMGGGSSSSDGSAEGSSNIRTELTPTELITHFSSQMESAGWQLLEDGNLDGFAWSSWLMENDQDDTWRGTLLLLKDPTEPNLVFALLRVVRISQ